MEKKVTILNEEGLHARPAGILAKKCGEFKSVIEVKSPSGVTKSAKSIMALMGMGLKKGDEITLIANGEDAEKALSSLSDLVSNRFAV